MARTNIPLKLLIANGQLDAPATTAVDATNGMNIQLADEGIPAVGKSEDLVLVVANTFTSPENIIIRAGASNPPAFRAGIGDLTLAVTNATTSYVGPFEWARFCQPDGSINVDFAAAFTGTIIALKVPRSL